ncbi:hypothetical protein DRO34_01315 [Candidatus Bathyarchaeota archaeon]|nr:MAG: hypothetical protein DRO34_01315 [Candidatus Bathyarchaeota archaeon]
MAFERKFQLVKAVLLKLEKKPMRWTPLLKAMIQECGSPPRLYYTLKFLEKNGFAEKILIKDKPHWNITPKGRELLKALLFDAKN